MTLTSARMPAQPLPQTRRRGFGVSRGLLLFVVGASVAVDVPIMGRVMGPDILCSIGLAVLLMGRGVRNFGKEAKLFFLMLGLWLFGAVITDLIRGTAFDDVVRGWSKMFFFGITFAYLYLITKERFFLIALFLLGLSVGSLAKLLVSPDDLFLAEPWKFGFGSLISLF